MVADEGSQVYKRRGAVEKTGLRYIIKANILLALARVLLSVAKYVDCP